MSSILVTGSADGLGLMAARQLIAEGHEVTVHGRSDARADDARAAAPGAAGALAGELASVVDVRRLAAAADGAGPFDGVIHNAGVGYRERRLETEDGLEHVFAINVLAPYLLTALMGRPRRLVYLSSGMARGGEPDLSDLQWERRRWSSSQAYADSKLMDVALALAVARHWPEVQSNAVSPGWVATRMGGAGAPDDLELGGETQAWLVAGDDPDTRVSGGCFYHRRPEEVPPLSGDPGFQEQLLGACAALTGAELPA